jgi:Short C-terminal domain
MPMRRGRPGLVGTMARTAVIAGTATAVAGGVRGRQEAKQEEAQQQAAAQQAAQDPPPAPPATGGDMAAELQKLADMKAQGLLSDEEFAAAKAKLLA